MLNRPEMARKVGGWVSRGGGGGGGRGGHSESYTREARVLTRGVGTSGGGGGGGGYYARFHGPPPGGYTRYDNHSPPYLPPDRDAPLWRTPDATPANDYGRQLTYERTVPLPPHEQYGWEGSRGSR